MYRYDEFDHSFVNARVAEFRDQVERRLAGEITDPSYRIQTSTEGLHIFNRDGFHSATDPFDLYPKLGVENDGGHAFYLGVELARAEIAWQLGKSYVQDEGLAWGCVRPRAVADLRHFAAERTTFKARRARRRDGPAS